MDRRTCFSIWRRISDISFPPSWDHIFLRYILIYCLIKTCTIFLQDELYTLIYT